MIKKGKNVNKTKVNSRIGSIGVARLNFSKIPLKDTCIFLLWFITPKKYHIADFIPDTSAG
jgi:hypothetical protein